ncbi:MAG: radical SAM protein [Clostridia bacterium]|nr:radical SAM protein [Clostridia bacterium]
MENELKRENELPGSLAELLADLDARGVEGYERYRSMKKYLTFKAREKGVPISGTFELTPLCNLDCKMCYVHLNKEQLGNSRLLGVEQWKSLMKQAVDAGMMYAGLTGGECLTYPGFKELYIYLQSMGVEVGMLTNGLLLTDDMVDFLKKNPPAHVRVTLYGADEDTYERVTGHRAFAKAYAGLSRLREARLPFSIAITPSRFLGADAGEAIIRLAAENGFNYNINSGLFAARDETGRKLEDYDVDLDDYFSLIRLKREMDGKAVLPSCAEDDLPPSGSRGEKRRGVRCGAARSSFSIAWDGTMAPCNTFLYYKANPLQIGFSEAWKYLNSAVADFVIPAECDGCPYDSICKHCVAEHLQGAPVGHANPAVCAWGRRYVREGFASI